MVDVPPIVGPREPATSEAAVYEPPPEPTVPTARAARLARQAPQCKPNRIATCRRSGPDAARRGDRGGPELHGKRQVTIKPHNKDQPRRCASTTTANRQQASVAREHQRKVDDRGRALRLRRAQLGISRWFRCCSAGTSTPFAAVSSCRPRPRIATTASARPPWSPTPGSWGKPARAHDCVLPRVRQADGGGAVRGGNGRAGRRRPPRRGASHRRKLCLRASFGRFSAGGKSRRRDALDGEALLGAAASPSLRGVRGDGRNGRRSARGAFAVLADGRRARLGATGSRRGTPAADGEPPRRDQIHRERQLLPRPGRILDLGRRLATSGVERLPAEIVQRRPRAGRFPGAAVQPVAARSRRSGGSPGPPAPRPGAAPQKARTCVPGPPRSGRASPGAGPRPKSSEPRAFWDSGGPRGNCRSSTTRTSRPFPAPSWSSPRARTAPTASIPN